MMKNERRFQTAASLRMALEERLNRLAREKGMDVQRLRRQVAFDRFLGRIAAAHGLSFVLKGGYALELRIDHARATKDIDLSFRGTGSEKARTISDPIAMQDRLQIAVGKSNDDFFEFVIGTAKLDIENAPAAGWRFPIEARLAGHAFIHFVIDVAIGDAWLAPHERITTPDWLGFAGIAAPSIPLISSEQQFAEKLHAYTRPRRIANSRVKDLVDLLLLSRLRGISPRRIREAAEKTFTLRGTHAFPPRFPLPSPSWSGPFRQLARECGMPVDLSEAIEEVSAYCERNRLAS
jgi:hypothetical protein